MSWLPLILIVIVFWFFMIRPQMKRQKELRQYRDALKKGDKIMTTGGIFGKIVDINNDNTVIIEVESQARMRVSKEAIVRDLLNSASNRVDRYSRNEIAVHSTVDVREIRRQADALSAEIRRTDNTIQELNWTTELE